MIINRGWNTHVQLKHLMTEKETPEAINVSMKAIAFAMRQSLAFRLVRRDFLELMEKCLEVDEANELLNAMYDYADEHRIWIE